MEGGLAWTEPHKPVPDGLAICWLAKEAFPPPRRLGSSDAAFADHMEGRLEHAAAVDTLFRLLCAHQTPRLIRLYRLHTR
jgi:hypothetical protein